MTAPRFLRLMRMLAAPALAAVVAVPFAVAAPAAAAVADGFTILASATFDDDGVAVPAEDVLVELIDPASGGVLDEMTTAQEGRWGFFDVAPAVYSVRFTSQNPRYPAESALLEDLAVVQQTDLLPFSITPFPRLGGGEVEVAGSRVLGASLTASIAPFLDVDGNPVTDTTWLEEPRWSYTSTVDGTRVVRPVGADLAVAPDLVGSFAAYEGLIVSSGYRPTRVFGYADGISAPRLEAGAAPVIDSSGLDAFFIDRSVAVGDSGSVGLPESLVPSRDFVASAEWYHGDSFVDVHAYSAARVVGSFPVVDGRVAVPLAAGLLADLGSGRHILVIIGQTSRQVQAVRFAVSPALAATGLDVGALIGASVLIAGIGSGLMVAGRRRRVELLSHEMTSRVGDKSLF